MRLFMYLLFSPAIVSLRGGKSFFMYELSIGLWGTLLLATPVYADFRYIFVRSVSGCYRVNEEQGAGGRGKFHMIK